MVTKTLDLLMPGSHPVPTRMQDSVNNSWIKNKLLCEPKIRLAAPCPLIEDKWTNSG